MVSHALQIPSIWKTHVLWVKKHVCVQNKLKSLKVAQVKDEMDDDVDEGCESVCDVAW